MKMKILIPVLIGLVALTAVSAVLLSPESQSKPLPPPSYEIDFAYSDGEKIQEILATQNIAMSVPTMISDYTVSQYCTFFDDENKQRFVKYCATAALVDSDGKPLGNFNMGGSSDSATMALAIVEVSPFLDSKEDEIGFIFQTIVDTLVCDCWEEQQPGGYASVLQWMDAAKMRFAESGQKTLKSTIDGLDGKQLILEITSSEESSYLWTLIVAK